MQLTSSQHNFGKIIDYTALSSFAFGTLLLLLGLAFRGFDLIYFIGYFFVVIAFLYNLLLLLIVISLLCIKWKNWEFYLKKALILCANIPVAILYLYIIFK